ncbi:hypothetical protein PAHAL_3G121400 [Panicum hallii]|uniref:Uncharacterized protein n=1 Tax=Panicum hallii TaxID=206008 RepID=A0A2S3H8I0_9POAL|nr:hypothetical protein PAHAL_3G121400 [Panicum hallii]
MRAPRLEVLHRAPPRRTASTWLSPLMKVRQSARPDDLFLLNVSRHPFCRAVSVLCIRPRTAAAREIRFELSCPRRFRPSYRSNHGLVSHEQRAVFRFACLDLSDGLPDSSDCHQPSCPSIRPRRRRG